MSDETDGITFRAEYSPDDLAKPYRVYAYWSLGEREIVTELGRFRLAPWCSEAPSVWAERHFGQQAADVRRMSIEKHKNDQKGAI